MILRVLRRVRVRLGVCLLLLAVGTIPFGLWLDGPRRQARVVRWIQANKGTALYADQAHPKQGWQVEESHPLRDLIERVVGRDALEPIVAVTLDVTATPDTRARGRDHDILPEEFAQLEGLTHLEYLQSGPVGDPHLAVIGRLRSLERLFTGLDEASPEGLANLARLSKLRWLHVGTRDFRDEHLAAISGARSLEELGLYLDEFDDSAFRHLVALPRLRYLMISSPGVPPERLGVLHLPPLPRLKKLDLFMQRVDVDGWRSIAGCDELETLRIYSDITDEGLYELRTLAALRDVDLNGKALTIEGLRRFLRESASLRSSAARPQESFSLNIAPWSRADADVLGREFPAIQITTKP